MNDVRRIIYGTIILFLVVLVAWMSIIYVASCGLTLTCGQAAPKVDRTPIPTLIPAQHSAPQMGAGTLVEFDQCQVSAADLVGAWVSAGSPEAEAFPFSDVNGKACEGAYAEDVQPLFVENGLWYKDAIGCVSCHNAELTDRSAGLDLTTPAALLLGSGRAAGSTSAGKDILGNGNWENSALYAVLVNQGFAPEGHSADNPPVTLNLYAGQAVPEATPTP